MSEKSIASATPTGHSNDESAAGLELMNDAASELGVKFAAPVTPKKATTPPADDDETEEERLAREEAGIDENGDGPEERAAKATKEGEEEVEETDEEREARETEEAGKGEETDEEKTARETAEAEALKKDPAIKEKQEAAATVALKLKDLEPAVRKRCQAVIDEVVGRVVSKERGESERLGGRVAELTAELETTQRQKGPSIVHGINPVFMADSVEQIDSHEENIEKFERWASKHKDGFEGDAAKGEQSFTAEQIENRLEQLLHEKRKLIPAARANLQQRATIDKNLREVYPALFDPKSVEYGQVQQVFKALPQLKQFPDARVIALKQILGDRALADFITKKYEKKPTGKDGKQPDPKAPKKPAPRAPGNGSTARGSVLTRPGSKPAAAAAVDKFTKGEGSLEDAVAALIG